MNVKSTSIDDENASPVKPSRTKKRINRFIEEDENWNDILQNDDSQEATLLSKEEPSKLVMQYLKKKLVTRIFKQFSILHDSCKTFHTSL